MQIDFQNCSLEIGYIGTPTEIFAEMMYDFGEKVVDAIHAMFDPLLKAITDLWEAMPLEIRLLAEGGA